MRAGEEEPTNLDLVDDVVELGGLRLVIRRPRDPEALLDEEAFEHEEFLPYWAELWPSARVLADELGARALDGRSVLELGAGLGLPSLVAASRGARVLATDWAPEAISLLVSNAARNALRVESLLGDWADPADLVARGPFDLVLGSDLLYERRNAPLLLSLLPQLVDGQGEVLVAEPGRPPAASFLTAAARSWRVETVAKRRAPTVTLHRLTKRGSNQ